MKMADETMHLDCAIRKASMDDAASLFILAAQFATSFRPEYMAFEVSLKELLFDDDAWLSIAEHQREVVGYCLGFDHYTFYANGRVSWVEEIMVKDEMRRLGVGKMLMNAFEEWARARSSKLVALATRRAAPFYAALGYEESATFFRKVL